MTDKNMYQETTQNKIKPKFLQIKEFFKMVIKIFFNHYS